MAPQRKMDIVTLKVKYESTVEVGHEKVSVVKNATSLKGSLSRVKHWFEDIITDEVSKVSPDIEPYFMEWEIETADPNLFVINGVRYDKVYAIFGAERVHWIYYTVHYPPKRVAGSDDLSFSFCGCCLHKQYLNIMKTIQESATIQSK